HYWMGGVATDLWGRTTVPGLLAVGEVACTGVHGANRLASNSLLEGAVFGHRAARALLGDPAAERVPAGPRRTDLVYADRLLGAPGAAGPAAPVPGDGAGAPALSRAALQELMWAHAGLIRDEPGLAHAEAVLTRWAREAGTSSPAPADRTDQPGPAQPGADRATLTTHEDANLLLLARLLTHAARARSTSLGAHFRSDAPESTAPSPELVLETH